MRKEALDWIQSGIQDLESDEYNLKGNQLKVCIFLCQQAAEKALKSVSIEKNGKFDKVHDLVYLGKKVNVSKDILRFCAELTPAYTYSRYPDAADLKISKSKASELFSYANEVMR